MGFWIFYWNSACSSIVEGEYFCRFVDSLSPKCPVNNKYDDLYIELYNVFNGTGDQDSIFDFKCYLITSDKNFVSYLD